jgi:DnaJ-like protein
MAWERIAENRIREAMQEGEFDNLPGAGKPLDLEGYFKLPEHLRVAFSILKSANCVPAEVELINEIATLEQQLAAAPGDQRPTIRRALSDRRTQLAVVLERARRT